MVLCYMVGSRPGRAQGMRIRGWGVEMGWTSATDAKSATKGLEDTIRDELVGRGGVNNNGAERRVQI